MIGDRYDKRRRRGVRMSTKSVLIMVGILAMIYAVIINDALEKRALVFLIGVAAAGIGTKLYLDAVKRSSTIEETGQETAPKLNEEPVPK